jgi:hypothetical protein
MGLPISVGSVAWARFHHDRSLELPVRHALSWIVWPQFAAVAFLTFGVVRGLSVFIGQLASSQRPPAEVVSSIWRLTEGTRLANSVITVLAAITVLASWR